MTFFKETLHEAIERELLSKERRDIQQANEDLSKRYRTPSGQTFMNSDAHRQAYLAARMPATYSAVYAVLTECLNRQPGFSINSLLDLGAGPGTALWAVAAFFDSLKNVTLLEQDAELIAIAKRLLLHATIPGLVWKQEAMQQAQQFDQHDLVILSYSIGELPQAERLPTIQKAWQAANKNLIIIEPGTPAGFERIRAIRSFLIAQNAHLVAPCPNSLPCPMKDGDWCHFSTRLERSITHRQTKQGTLGYEDEKYSYLIVSKTPVTLPTARILRHPQKRSGHLNFTICENGKLSTLTLSKRNGDLYKEARKKEWGDSLETVLKL